MEHTHEKTKKHVIIVVNTFGRGGAEMSLAILASELAKTGHTVSYVALWKEEHCYNFDWLEKQNVSINVLSESRNLFESFTMLFRLLRKVKPEIIYSAMLDANLVSQLCASMLKIPHIASVRTNPAQFYKDALCKRLAFAFVMYLQKNIIFISERALNEYTASCYGKLLSNKRLFVLHNPVEIKNALTDQYLRKKYLEVSHIVRELILAASSNENPGFPLYFVMVSRLVDGKGIMEVLEQLRRPFSNNRLLHLSIYGTGPLESQIKGYVAREFTYNNVALKGFCADLDSIFSASDILIFPSRNEGFGRVPFEAIMRGNLVLCNAAASIVHEFISKPSTWVNYDEPLDLWDKIQLFADLDPTKCCEEVNKITEALSPLTHADNFDEIAVICTTG